MLLDVPYKSGDTVSLKLSNGDEVVARLEDESGDVYKLHKPMMLMQSPQGQLLLSQLLYTASPTTVTIPKKNVMFVAKTMEEMAKNYIESTTGIQTV